jgi:hypothetical protein
MWESDTGIGFCIEYDCLECERAIPVSVFALNIFGSSVRERQPYRYLDWISIVSM